MRWAGNRPHEAGQAALRQFPTTPHSAPISAYKSYSHRPWQPAPSARYPGKPNLVYHLSLCSARISPGELITATVLSSCLAAPAAELMHASSFPAPRFPGPGQTQSCLLPVGPGQPCPSPFPHFLLSLLSPSAGRHSACLSGPTERVAILGPRSFESKCRWCFIQAPPLSVTRGCSVRLDALPRRATPTVLTPDGFLTAARQ